MAEQSRPWDRHVQRFAESQKRPPQHAVIRPQPPPYGSQSMGEQRPPSRHSPVQQSAEVVHGWFGLLQRQCSWSPQVAEQQPSSHEPWLVQAVQRPLTQLAGPQQSVGPLQGPPALLHAQAPLEQLPVQH
jgi:hypothetical protein